MDWVVGMDSVESRGLIGCSILEIIEIIEIIEMGKCIEILDIIQITGRMPIVDIVKIVEFIDIGESGVVSEITETVYNLRIEGGVVERQAVVGMDVIDLTPIGVLHEIQ